MDNHTFDALTRRASLLTLGVASLAGVAGSQRAKAKKKGNGDSAKKCKKQVDKCEAGIAELCEIVFGDDAELCIPLFAPCCAFLKSCDAGQAFACAAEAAASIEA